MSTISSNPTPQFQTAEYAGVAGTEACHFCQSPIAGRYYRVNEQMACEECGTRAQLELPSDGHGRYARALLFGLGAAILGLILYASFEILTGWIIGYLSLAVGYMVGKAIKMGSRGAGGRKYQVTAVALTYAAVSLAAVPVYFATVSKTAHPGQKNYHFEPSAAAKQPDHADQQARPERQKMSLGAALAVLLGVGLISPFLELAGDPMQGVLGLVILAVGVRIAWRLAAGGESEIFGPFETSPTTTPSNLT